MYGCMIVIVIFEVDIDIFGIIVDMFVVENIVMDLLYENLIETLIISDFYK